MECAGEERPVGRSNLLLARQTVSQDQIERNKKKDRQNDQQQIAQNLFDDLAWRDFAFPLPGPLSPCASRNQCFHNIYPFYPQLHGRNLTIIALLRSTKAQEA